MRRFLIVGFLLLATGIAECLTESAVAESPAADPFAAMSDQEFSDWVSYYYRSPEPALIPAAIQKMSSKGYLTNPDTVPPMAGFLANHFAAHPELIGPTLQDAQYAWHLPNPDQQTLLAVAILALNAAPDKQARLFDKLDALGQKVVPWFLANGIHGHDQVQPISASALDFIWGSFFATGNTDLVLPLVGALAEPKYKAKKDKEDVMKLLVHHAAVWSLGANARQHPKIMEFCKQQISKQPPEIAEKLQKIVEGK